MTLHRDAYPSPNYSSRGGSGVTHIVVHTAEGALTYQSLGHYFADPAADVSSHVGIDDTDGVVGEYVQRDGKAWTASNANPWSVQAELCGFAAWDTAEWNRHPVMLANCAQWVAEEAAHFGLPLDSIAASAQDSAARGVCQHNDLGSMGGGHWDCGPGFPVDHVLDLARGARPQPVEDDMNGPTLVDTRDGIVLFWTMDGSLMTVLAGDAGHPERIWTLGHPGTGPLVSGPDATVAADGSLQVTAAGPGDQVWMIGRTPAGEWQSWWAVGGRVG